MLSLGFEPRPHVLNSEKVGFNTFFISSFYLIFCLEKKATFFHKSFIKNVFGPPSPYKEKKSRKKVGSNTSLDHLVLTCAICFRRMIFIISLTNMVHKF